MEEILQILSLKIKPKDKVSRIVYLIEKDPEKIHQLIVIFENGSDVDKGTCADIMKHLSKINPEIFLPYLELLIDYINYKVPRVKWGIPETIGNIAQKYPEQVVAAVPKLLVNTLDESTVIRWCAAYALTEILVHNITIRNELKEKIEELALTEQNNGVKQVYLKALKKIKL